MSSSSEDETDISDSELEDYVDQCYELLKDGHVKVQFSDELYRCPYCPGKKKLVYQYKDLLQHASDVAKGSQNKDIKHKGKHLSLVKYMKNHLLRDDLSSVLTGLTLDLPPGKRGNDVFVWPWIGILANVGVSSSSLKNDLARKGFDPFRVRLLPNDKDKPGYALVEFKKDWSGFYNVMMFEKEFDFDHHGKKDYDEAPLSVGKCYGWIARDDDFNSKGILGEYLRKSGDLKTIADIEADEKRKNALLITNLSNTIDELRGCLDELETKHGNTP